MRLFYNFLAYLLFLPFGLFWLGRAIWNPAYRPKLGQRFGIGHPKLKESIWVHAVSVGEVVAAEPLIRSLLREFPDHPLLVTTVTPTGAQRVALTFGSSVHHAYIPFEAPACVNQFFRRVDPALALIVETEIWPNLYRACGVRDIPLVLVSARISPRSVRSYSKFLPLFRETLSHGIIIAAQSNSDAKRFLSLGASPERTQVTGNIKFDIELPKGIARRGYEFRQHHFGQRPVWIAASTHEGEEAIVLDAHRMLLERHPDLVLLLVPRHPERFDGVEELVRQKGFEPVTRTEDKPLNARHQVFLGNTMGELLLFYGASDIAFVAGSLVPIGGHNLLEPAALGLPIVFGPHMFNAQEIADEFLEANASRMVANGEELAAEIHALLKERDDARELGIAALHLVEKNRGAVEHLIGLLPPLVNNG